jgi:predicted dithiol-disulfide oxidoreductase (DUF899 family)
MDHTEQIRTLEQEALVIANRLELLRRENTPTPVKNYALETLTGPTDLLTLFGDKEKLLMIHNMGHACRWCTSWADGLNAALPHLENSFAVVLVSKNNPPIQRQFALSRGWNFRMVSHGGGEYNQEQSVTPGEPDMPGIVCYERQNAQIFRKNASEFGPGDFFNPLFHVVTLAGIGLEEFTPQFTYWNRPGQMDDGGENL